MLSGLFYRPLRLARLGLLTLVLAAPQPPSATADERNVYGIQTLVPPDSTAQTAKHLAWARALVGPGGHVTQPFYPVGQSSQNATAEAVAFVEQAYALGLHPIVRLQGDYANGTGCDPNRPVGWQRPIPDVEGAAPPTYSREAAGFARFVAELPRIDGRTLYVQVWNEPNLHFMWGGAANPSEYARFFVETSDAIRALGDERIKVLNAALAPEGDVDNLQFIAEAITSEPRFRTAFDFWASHPYPHNQPPANNLHDGTALPGSRYTIDAYLLELERLRASGVDTSALRVVLTETGYKLDDDWYPHYPIITEQNRSEYIREAFDRYWSRWPEVLTVTPFNLSDPQGSWREFEWVWSSSGVDANGFPVQPRLQYARMLPGVGTVTGTVTDENGKPMRSVTVEADLNGHRAVTVSDGSYVLIGYPGTYRLSATKSGYTAPSAEGVEVTQGGIATVNFTLTGSGITRAPRNPSIESGDLSDWTAWGNADGVQQGKWFAGVGPYDGEYFLGSAANCSERDGGFFQPVAATPGTPVQVSAWLLTYKEGSAPMASRIGVDPHGGTDPGSRDVVWSPWTRTGGAWRQVKLQVVPQATRMTIFLQHDQNVDNPWNISGFDRIEVVEVGP